MSLTDALNKQITRDEWRLRNKITKKEDTLMHRLKAAKDLSINYRWEYKYNIKSQVGWERAFIELRGDDGDHGDKGINVRTNIYCDWRKHNQIRDPKYAEERLKQELPELMCCLRNHGISTNINVYYQKGEKNQMCFDF